MNEIFDDSNLELIDGFSVIQNDEYERLMKRDLMYSYLAGGSVIMGIVTVLTHFRAKKALKKNNILNKEIEDLKLQIAQLQSNTDEFDF